jgi:hypothetical protein
LVGTCSKWYDTAAVYEIDSEHWPDVKARFASAGTPGAIFGDFKTRECDPSLRSLLSVPDTAATVAVGRDQLYWSTDTSQRRVYWQVSVD